MEQPWLAILQLYRYYRFEFVISAINNNRWFYRIYHCKPTGAPQLACRHTLAPQAPLGLSLRASTVREPRRAPRGVCPNHTRPG